MSGTNCTAHRGIALLLALVALSLLSVTGVGVLRSATNASVSSSVDSEEAAARAIVRELTPLLLGWAEEHVELWQAELGAERHETRDMSKFFSILGERSAFVNDRHIAIEAIDLSGRLHVSKISTLAATGLHVDLGGALIEIGTPASPGQPRLLEQHFDPAWPIFPKAAAQDKSERAACLWITTHGSGALNLSTAPLSLLRAALIGLDPTVSRRIVEARRKGEPISPEDASGLVRARHAALGDDPNGRLVPLTTRSDSFGFIVSVSADADGLPPRRWWVVAAEVVATDRGRPRRPEWRVVEWRRIP